MKVISPDELRKTGTYVTKSGRFSYRDKDGLIKSSTSVGNNSFRLSSTSSKVYHLDRFNIESVRTNYLPNTSNGNGDPNLLVGKGVVFIPNLEDTAYLTLSFFGSGVVTVTDNSTARVYRVEGNTNSTSTYPAYKTFPRGSGSLTVEFSGTVFAANLEGVSARLLNGITDELELTRLTRPTSWIPTLNSSPAQRPAVTVTLAGHLVNSFAADEYQFWSSNVTYNIGTIVEYSSYLYISLADGNYDKAPGKVGSESYWQLLRASNDSALIDFTTYNKSVATNGTSGAYFTYIIPKPGNEEKNLALIEIGAKYCDAVIQLATNAGTFISNVSLENARSVVLKSTYTDLPKSQDLVIDYIIFSVFLHNGISPTTGEMLLPDSTVDIGEVVLGKPRTLGTVQYGMRSSITDYSVKQTNEFGTTIFVKRGFSKKLNCDLFLSNSKFNEVLDTLSDLRATPAVWVASDIENISNASVILGTYNDFSLVVQYPEHSLCSLEIEGLVI